MPEKRLLYFTTKTVRACSWSGGKLTSDALFEGSEEDIAEFTRYVAGAPRALYYLLVDIVEEDFHQETIPYVRGNDRHTILERKLAQRYRDLSLAMALSLGYESGPRREESILFASFSNTQPFQPWLAALVSQEARVAGVFSLALLAPALAKSIGIPHKRFLLASWQQVGMRQSFVDNGQIRFSRLGQSDGIDSTQRARYLASETTRLQQYLTNMRMLARDSGILDVIVLAPDQELAQYRAACVNTQQVSYTLIGVSDACKKAGLKEAPADMLAERLYMHSLALSPPSHQFADDNHRRFFNVWRAKIGSMLAGAAVLGLCLLFSAVRLYDYYDVQTQVQIDQKQERSLNEQYASLQAQFQKTPTSKENLKALVKNYLILQKQSIPLDRIFAELSVALAAVPQIELERIQWQVGSEPRAAAGTRATKAPPRPEAKAEAKAEGEPVYEIVEIGGRVNTTQASDYRNITLLVNQFADALRARPGIEVSSTQLPFDMNAEKSITGDIGAQREAEVPRFTIVFSRRSET